MTEQANSPQTGQTTTQSVPVAMSALQLIDRSRQGLTGPEAGRVAGLLGITDKEMARLLNQSVATFHRQARAGRLDAATSERVLLLGQLAVYGATVFQDHTGPASGGSSPGGSSPGTKFTRWLRRPLRLLADRSPLDLLDSPTGVQLIDDILGRIEYGVFS